jgi:hypothetical protein
MAKKTTKGGYFVIHASFSQIIELRANLSQSWENAVFHFLHHDGGNGVKVRFWHPDTGEYIDRRVFMYAEPLPVADKKPGKAANCQTRKRNRKNESNEQHIASHFGGLYLEADDDAEKIKAFVVPNTSQDFL